MALACLHKPGGGGGGGGGGLDLNINYGLQFYVPKPVFIL